MFERTLCTEDLPAADRFAWWRDMTSQTHMPTVVHSGREKDFRASLRVLDFGAVTVSSQAHPPLRVSRSWKEIRRGDPGMYCVAVLGRGQAGFVQADREAEFGPRQLLLFDTSRPFHGWMNTGGRDDIRHLIMQVPRDALSLPSGALSNLTAVTLPARDGLGALLLRYLGELVREAGHYSAADVARLSAITTDLLTAFCANRLNVDAAFSPEARRQVLQTQILDFIEQHLADPALTVDSIAAAHHISTRYLYKLFAETGLGVAGWIRRRRLERCRRDLADPRLHSYPIRAIAARWGFTDAHQFSRAFRTTFGMSPQDFRA